MIYFTSDTHYWHKNIAGPKVSVWKGGYRDFEDEKEMSQHIVKVFNKILREDDVLYHLGDWSFGGKQNIWNFRKQLNCKEIHLILGNHDHHIEKNTEIDVGIEGEDRLEYLTGNGINPFKKDDGKRFIGCKSFFESVQHYKELVINGQGFVLSHYPMLSWNHCSRGVIMLHGHEHGNFNHLNINCKRLDVGLDSAKIILGEYRPFSITEVKDLCSKKDILKLGHHQGQF